MNFEEMRNFAREKGFILERLDRGKNERLTSVSGRFEIWISGKYGTSKISFANTLEEALDKAWPEVQEYVIRQEPCDTSALEKSDRILGIHFGA